MPPLLAAVLLLISSLVLRPRRRATASADIIEARKVGHAWVAYGLGSENANLPGYVVLQSGGAVAPHGGVGLFSNGFLPAQHQGSILAADRREAVSDLVSPTSLEQQSQRLALTRALDGVEADPRTLSG